VDTVADLIAAKFADPPTTLGNWVAARDPVTTNFLELLPSIGQRRNAMP
jgi:hypothetical protein